MPLLGKEVLAAYVCSMLVTSSTAIKNLSLGCQLPKLMRILSRTCVGLNLPFCFNQNLLWGGANLRERGCASVAYKDAYPEPAKRSMRRLCICVLAGIHPRRAPAVVLSLLSSYYVWQQSSLPARTRGNYSDQRCESWRWTKRAG
jgi:hypothetical protein